MKVHKDALKKLDYKIEVSPFGAAPCCCGHTNCVNLNCFNYCKVKHKELGDRTFQQYDKDEEKAFMTYKKTT